MANHYIDTWDAEDGVATCIVSNGKHSGYGGATCHPSDKDFQSARTGAVIAQARAEISLLQDIKDNEVTPGIQALNHVLGTMWNSKQFNPNSYEARRLQQELNNLIEYKDSLKQQIKEQKTFLATYIKEKDDFYTRLRDKKAKNN